MNQKTSIFSLSLWRAVGKLAKPFFTSDKPWEITVPLIGYKFSVKEKWKAWGLVLLLSIFLVSVNKMNAMINGAYGDFQNALPAKDGPTAWKNLWFLAEIFVAAGPVVVFYAWFKSLLSIVWRRWLTEHLLEKYFSNRNYYRISNNSLVDNPDERIANDVDGFVSGALGLVLTAVDSVVTLFFFTQILWSLSHSLAALSILYSMFGTLISIWLSVKLITFKYNQQRLEADYRYGLINIRNNVEPIAFYQGEKAEWKELLRRFHAAIKNNLSLVGYQRRVSIFTTWFDYFVAVVPFIVIMPLYLDGKVQLGAFTQSNMAFGQVLGALSLFVSQIGTISAFAAYVNRLQGFDEALDAKDESEKEGRTAISTSVGEKLAFNNVTLMTPDYKRLLVKDLSAEIPLGTGIIIKGPSGSGKSSLLRAIAGLWKSGSGTIERPDLKSLMFLSQKPYMKLGTLRDQLLYPVADADVSDDTLKQALVDANLPELADRYPEGLDAVRPWTDELSPGEQQRLAFARLLVHKPTFVFLDEATSALDVKNEQLLYRTLQKIGATYVSVGHRPTLDQYHQKAITLIGEGAWELV